MLSGRWPAVLAAITAILLLACNTTEEEPQDAAAVPTATASLAVSPSPDPPPATSPVPVPEGYTKYRWGNVTVVVPDGVVSVVRTLAVPEENPPDGGLILYLVDGGITQNSVLVDADDGRITRQTEAIGDNIKAAVETIRVGEPMKDPGPWPRFEEDPSTPKEIWHSLEYWSPHPESGIILIQECGEATDPAASGCAVAITNGISTLAVDTATGAVVSHDVLASDSEAFNRWLASVEVAAP